MSFKKSKSATYIGYEGTGAKLDLGETGYFSTIPQLQPHKPHNNHIDCHRLSHDIFVYCCLLKMQGSKAHMLNGSNFNALEDVRNMKI